MAPGYPSREKASQSEEANPQALKSEPAEAIRRGGSDVPTIMPSNKARPLNKKGKPFPARESLPSYASKEPSTDENGLLCTLAVPDPFSAWLNSFPRFHFSHD
jgi:hypothetical protein